MGRKDFRLLRRYIRPPAQLAELLRGGLFCVFPFFKLLRYCIRRDGDPFRDRFFGTVYKRFADGDPFADGDSVQFHALPPSHICSAIGVILQSRTRRAR